MTAKQQPYHRLTQFKTPCFIVDRALLKKNLSVLQEVKHRTGCGILLALKGFAMHAVFPDLAPVLDGVCASSPHEARMGRTRFGKEVHAFAAAYGDDDFSEILQSADHIVFNSMGQYRCFENEVKRAVKDDPARYTFGLRINPEHRETEVELYDPCAPFSRLGIISRHFPAALPEHITGLHFHTLCEKNADALERTLAAAEEKFHSHFKQCEWVNFGGGHHITREDYDVDMLCRLVNGFKKKYGVQVYLEPGEAVALNTGFLVASVLDVVENGMPVAVLDMSAAAHTPDVLEMPYRPYALGSGEKGEKRYSYRLAGLSCLAGDVVGDYSFDEPLERGSKIVFTDMAHYSMVKTNTFNGIKLPDIYYVDSNQGQVLFHKSFGYTDFESRLS